MQSSISIADLIKNNFNTLEGDEIKVNDSRQLHEPQLDPRYLKYIQSGEISGLKIFTSDAVNFPLHPDESVLHRLKKISLSDSNFVRYFKLVTLAGSNSQLFKLIMQGIRSGLSKGTMDIIYRIGTSQRVQEVLDNLAIAVGSLQRRLIVSDLIGKLLHNLKLRKIVSIAGGSCLLPIEGIYQSGLQGVELINIDISQEAYKKALATMESINSMRNIGISLNYVSRDILNNGLGINRDDNEVQLFECTGFWEYLEDEQRKQLLSQLSSSIGDNDLIVITALIDNPQQEIFDAIKFKKLKPQPANELIPFINEYFDIKFAVLNGNRTYMTLVLQKI